MKNKEENEFKEIQKAIDNWVKVNKGNVSFIGSFVSFDEKKVEENAEDITKDTLVVGYGGKEEVKIAIDALHSYLEEEKDDFVNW